MQINQIVKVIGESLFGSTILSGCEAKVVELDENNGSMEVKVESLTNKNITLWYNIANLHEDEQELPPIIPKYKEGDIVEVCGQSYMGSSCYMGAKGKVLFPITSDKTEVSYRVELNNMRIPVKFKESDIKPIGNSNIQVGSIVVHDNDTELFEVKSIDSTIYGRCLNISSLNSPKKHYYVGEDIVTLIKNDGYNKKVDLSIKDNGSNVEISMSLDKNMEKGRFTVTQNGKPAYYIHVKKLK